MKRSVYGALSLLAVALLIGVPVLQAQSQVRADVPFAWSMDQHSMPAGNYQIASISERVLVLRNLDSGESRLLLKAIQVEGRQGHARLVFHKYDDQYFLSEIWDGRSDRGVQFAESKRERELQMAGLDLPREAQIVIVAMK